MKVCILGIDGYLGWSLALHLKNRGHEVWGIDNGYRRNLVAKVGSGSLIPIGSIQKRQKMMPNFYRGNIASGYEDLKKLFVKHEPEAIVHLAEQPSAPYSMRSARTAVETHVNNLVGTLNVLWAMKEVCAHAHLVKLGTMGEYGTPNVPIPEGYFEIEYGGRKDRLPFPRQAGSFYHQTKVFDTQNIAMACRFWGLRATDIMQGVVYGACTDDIRNAGSKWATRLDYDECFGTTLNRFCLQAALGMPLTVYGKGGQTRGFININDSMRCFELAILNPAGPGEHRVFNQFGTIHSVLELAEKVQHCAQVCFNTDARIDQIANPRVEAEEHFYEPEMDGLVALGFTEPRHLEVELPKLLKACFKYRENAVTDVIMPSSMWR